SVAPDRCAKTAGHVRCGRGTRPVRPRDTSGPVPGLRTAAVHAGGQGPMRTYTDGADTAGGDPLSAPDPAQRTTTTAEPWPNSPWLALMPTRAPATCRAPAAPLSCQVSSHTWVAACAGTASPKEAGPPLMFTGVRP